MQGVYKSLDIASRSCLSCLALLPLSVNIYVIGGTSIPSLCDNGGTNPVLLDYEEMLNEAGLVNLSKRSIGTPGIFVDLYVKSDGDPSWTSVDSPVCAKVDIGDTGITDVNMTTPYGGGTVLGTSFEHSKGCNHMPKQFIETHSIPVGPYGRSVDGVPSEVSTSGSVHAEVGMNNAETIDIKVMSSYVHCPRLGPLSESGFTGHRGYVCQVAYQSRNAINNALGISFRNDVHGQDIPADGIHGNVNTTHGSMGGPYLSGYHAASCITQGMVPDRHAC